MKFNLILTNTIVTISIVIIYITPLKTRTLAYQQLYYLYFCFIFLVKFEINHNDIDWHQNKLLHSTFLNMIEILAQNDKLRISRFLSQKPNSFLYEVKGYSQKSWKITKINKFKEKQNLAVI